MNYFGQSEKSRLAQKKKLRAAMTSHTDSLRSLYQDGRTSYSSQLELFFIDLASRLLRAKFYAFPGYTNDEMSFELGCSSGTYLGLIMTRQKVCSREMALMISENLKKMERAEGMQPMAQTPYPEA